MSWAPISSTKAYSRGTSPASGAFSSQSSDQELINRLNAALQLHDKIQYVTAAAQQQNNVKDADHGVYDNQLSSASVNGLQRTWLFTATPMRFDKLSATTSSIDCKPLIVAPVLICTQPRRTSPHMARPHRRTSIRQHVVNLFLQRQFDQDGVFPPGADRRSKGFSWIHSET